MNLLVQPGSIFYSLSLIVSGLCSIWMAMVVFAFAEPEKLSPGLLLLLMPFPFLFAAFVKARSGKRVFPILGAIGSMIYPLLFIYAIVYTFAQSDNQKAIGGSLYVVIVCIVAPLFLLCSGFVLSLIKFKQLSTSR